MFKALNGFKGVKKSSDGLDFISLTSMASKFANTGLGRAVLPKPLSDLISTMNSLNGDAKILADRMNDPINGPLIPFCTKGYTFDGGRISFCASVVKDCLLILAGGTGLATLAQTLSTQPDQMFMFMTEVLIPLINQLALEGHTLFKVNLDRALSIIVGPHLNTDNIMNMSSDTFVAMIGQSTAAPQAAPLKTLHNCRCTCRSDQIGGAKKTELQAMCRHLGLPCYGTKAVLVHRLATMTGRAW